MKEGSKKRKGDNRKRRKKGKNSQEAKRGNVRKGE